MKALIFDFDGVLIDSLTAHMRILRRIAAEQQITITDNDFYKMNGMNTQSVLQYLKKEKHFRVTPLMLFKYKSSRKELLEGISLYPETIPCLESVSQYKKAIATSSPRKYLKHNLDRFDLEKYFDAFVSATDVKEGKPAPDLFLLAAKQLHEDPGNCVVIEDAVNGIVAAKKAGMKAVALLTTTPQEYFRDLPDAFIHSLDELPSVINNS